MIRDYNCQVRNDVFQLIGKWDLRSVNNADIWEMPQILTDSTPKMKRVTEIQHPRPRPSTNCLTLRKIRSTGASWILPYLRAKLSENRWGREWGGVGGMRNWMLNWSFWNLGIRSLLNLLALMMDHNNVIFLCFQEK